MSLRECKRCLLLESAENDIFSDVKAHIGKIPENEKAGPDLYEKRLGLCRECDNLISGVCMKCGCYVEFRAAFATQKCPDTSRRKW